jgi:hypothetical protein
MIPTHDVTPAISSPPPTCDMPTPEDITEEGFGYFRGTWFIGRVPVTEAEQTVRREDEIIEWLDGFASSPEDFELLACAIESSDAETIPEPLRTAALRAGIEAHMGESGEAPLDGLEIGVAGLTHALSAIRCLTAASCRSHVDQRSWSDCPVLFFAAPSSRVELLAELTRAEGCGLEADRGMLKIYGPSIRSMNHLAGHVLAERARFRKRPDSTRPQSRRTRPRHVQLTLMLR